MLIIIKLKIHIVLLTRNLKKKKNMNDKLFTIWIPMILKNRNSPSLLTFLKICYRNNRYH